MSKDLNFIKLLDIYGSVLTDKQRDAVDLYYNEDLSLAEIAEHTGITRQGVLDSIKRSELNLNDLDEKLKFSEKFDILESRIAVLEETIEQIYNDVKKYKYSIRMQELAEEAMKNVKEVKESI